MCRRMQPLGIAHVFGLGFSPGVVTSPLAWIAEHLRLIQHPSDSVEYKLAVDFFGDDDYHGNPLKRLDFDRIIILTTKEVIGGEVKSFYDNPFGSPKPTDVGFKDLATAPVLECVWDFIHAEVKTSSGHVPDIYCSLIQLDDFMYNLHVTLDVIRWLAPRDGVGKHTWLNATGGSNVLNTAMLTAAYLMGTIGRLYYTYVTPENGACLRPPAQAGDTTFWFDLPPLRVSMVAELSAILTALVNSNQPLTAADLLNQLQSTDAALFSTMKVGTLKGLYLNKLDPRYVTRNRDNTNQISQSGRALLKALATTDTSGVVNQPANLIKLTRLEDAQQLLVSNSHANP